MASFSFKKTAKEQGTTEMPMGEHKVSRQSYSTHTEATAFLNESLRTYVTDSSFSQQDVSQKEEAKKILEECQEQLSALTEKVERMDIKTPKTTPNNRKRLPDKPKRKSSKYLADSSQSSSSSETAQSEQNQPLHTRSGNSRQSVQRRSVVYSRGRRSKNKQSLRRDSIHSCRSFNRTGLDGDASRMTSNSLHSASHSVKSLPREIELMDESNDEDNDDCSFFDESVRYQDNVSVASQGVYSQSVDFSHISHSTEGSAQSQSSSRRSRSRRRGGTISRKSSFNAKDTIQVENQEIVDPYGEEGVYSGALSLNTGMPNGRGLLEYHKNGRWCEGDWLHGRLTGYGRLSNGSGDNYEGQLKNDHFHGYGVMQFDNGRVFEGTYVKGQMVQGKMTYQDGSVYDGSWVNCARHGSGKCIFGDGSVYEGGFKAGHFHGHGKMTWNDGGYYVGDWFEGQMHGQGREIRPDGSTRHDGDWKHDQPVRHKNRKN